jgi:hypothetical protein
MARKKLPDELKAKNHTFNLYDWEVEIIKDYIKEVRQLTKAIKTIYDEPITYNFAAIPKGEEYKQYLMEWKRKLENNPDVHMVHIGNIKVK